MPVLQAPAPFRPLSRAWHLLSRLRRIRRPDLLVARRLGALLSDRHYLAIGYRLYFGEWPNYDHPRTFNEHIHAYMLRCRSPLLHITADKALTRDHVERTIGPQYLVPALGLWPDATSVPIETLPRPRRGRQRLPDTPDPATLAGHRVRAHEPRVVLRPAARQGHR
jgi:hypothetical protein